MASAVPRPVRVSSAREAVGGVPARSRRKSTVGVAVLAQVVLGGRERNGFAGRLVDDATGHRALGLHADRQVEDLPGGVHPAAGDPDPLDRARGREGGDLHGPWRHQLEPELTLAVGDRGLGRERAGLQTDLGARHRRHAVNVDHASGDGSRLLEDDLHVSDLTRVVEAGSDRAEAVEGVGRGELDGPNRELELKMSGLVGRGFDVGALLRDALYGRTEHGRPVVQRCRDARGARRARDDLDDTGASQVDRDERPVPAEHDPGRSAPEVPDMAGLEAVSDVSVEVPVLDRDVVERERSVGSAGHLGEGVEHDADAAHRAAERVEHHAVDAAAHLAQDDRLCRDL